MTEHRAARRRRVAVRRGGRPRPRRRLPGAARPGGPSGSPCSTRTGSSELVDALVEPMLVEHYDVLGARAARTARTPRRAEVADDLLGGARRAPASPAPTPW